MITFFILNTRRCDYDMEDGSEANCKGGKSGERLQKILQSCRIFICFKIFSILSRVDVKRFEVDVEDFQSLPCKERVDLIEFFDKYLQSNKVFCILSFLFHFYVINDFVKLNIVHQNYQRNLSIIRTFFVWNQFIKINLIEIIQLVIHMMSAWFLFFILNWLNSPFQQIQFTESTLIWFLSILYSHKLNSLFIDERIFQLILSPFSADFTLRQTSREIFFLFHDSILLPLLSKSRPLLEFDFDSSCLRKI